MSAGYHQNECYRCGGRGNRIVIYRGGLTLWTVDLNRLGIPFRKLFCHGCMMATLNEIKDDYGVEYKYNGAKQAYECWMP